VAERRGAIGQGAGSGFILDDSGRIVTNNHVVAGADRVTVIFFNGIEAEAEILGTDDDSDLAVIEVDELPDGTYPLALADSDQAKVGQWVVAIGNPFGLSGSMTLGIVSAVGRTIPSGATTYSIPEAIQTDAAINPGNSGGPLLNLQGEVLGVNAQIRTNGERANAGVGFAIPSNTVQLVAPVLVRRQPYQWPWVGVQGANVTLLIMEANDLETQQGAYIDRVIANSPAAEGGLRGTSDTRSIDSVPIPVGGDVVVAVDGQPVVDFADLLVRVAFRSPGDTLELTVLRDGQSRQVSVTLAPRPEAIDQ
jgi:2-alkenal reductase